MNVRSRNRSVVAAHLLSLDTRLCLALWPRPQFWQCQRRKPRPPRHPPRPRRHPPMRRSLGRSAVRSGEAGEQNGVRNAAPDAQSGAKSDAQDATSDGTALHLPPSRKSNRFISGQQWRPARLSAGRKGRTGPPQRRATGQRAAPRQRTGRPRNGQYVKLGPNRARRVSASSTTRAANS